MCMNLEVSLLTGLTTQIIGYYLWKRNFLTDRRFSIFLMCFGLIQFAEAIIWLEKKLGINYLTMFSLNYLIPLIFALEPLASLYGAYYSNHKINKQMVGLYLGISCFLFYRGYLKSPQDSPIFTPDGISYSNCNNKDGLFSYEYCGPTIYNSLGYFLLLAYPFQKYLTKPKIISYITNLALLITLILGYIMRPTAGGSYWCLYSTGLSYLYLFAPIWFKVKVIENNDKTLAEDSSVISD